MMTISELKADSQYALLIRDKHIKPKNPFVIGIEFDQPGDPTQYISAVERWDGSGGEDSFRGIDFKEES